jgi:hypothetical protein
MPLSLKIKLVVTLLITTLSVVIRPAGAEAPQPYPDNANREPLLISEAEMTKLRAWDDPKGYAHHLVVSKYGWDNKEFDCLVTLWTKESNWRHNADNPKSSAYGIAQMLKEDAKHPAEQISNGLRYILHRYESPCNAWKFWRSHYWY